MAILTPAQKPRGLATRIFTFFLLTHYLHILLKY